MDCTNVEETEAGSIKITEKVDRYTEMYLQH